MNFIIDNNRIYINTSSSDVAKFKEEIQKLPKEQKQGAGVRCYNTFIGFILSLFGYASKINLGNGDSLYVNNRSFIHFIIRDKEVNKNSPKMRDLGTQDTVIKLHELYLKHQYKDNDVRLMNEKLNKMLGNEDPINVLIDRLEERIRHESLPRDVVDMTHGVPGAKQNVTFAKKVSVLTPENEIVVEEVSGEVKQLTGSSEIEKLKAELKEKYDEYKAWQLVIFEIFRKEPDSQKRSDLYFIHALLEKLIDEELKDFDSCLNPEQLQSIRAKALKELDAVIVSTNKAISDKEARIEERAPGIQGKIKEKHAMLWKMKGRKSDKKKMEELSKEIEKMKQEIAKIDNEEENYFFQLYFPDEMASVLKELIDSWIKNQDRAKVITQRSDR